MKTGIILLVSYVLFSIIINDVSSGKKFVSNLNAVCIRCLCYASTQCNMTVGCQKGYCGPLFMTKEYWKDAGRPTLKDDDPDRINAFNDCAKDYACASTAVENYMAKFGYDCNNDGVTDCDDYARLHFHGPQKCSLPISNLYFGKRYETCKPVPSFPKEIINVKLKETIYPQNSKKFKIAKSDNRYTYPFVSNGKEMTIN